MRIRAANPIEKKDVGIEKGELSRVGCSKKKLDP
jgi:hypothetical protein